MATPRLVAAMMIVGLLQPGLALSNDAYPKWRDEALAAQAAEHDELVLAELPIKEIIPVVHGPGARRQARVDEVHATTGAEISLLLEGAGTVDEDWKGYVADFIELFKRLPPQYLHVPFWTRFGDAVEPRPPHPTLAKTRAIGDHRTVLLPLNYDRHFGEAFQQLASGAFNDYSFWEKQPKVFWRGSTTDSGWDPKVCAPHNHRRALIERWGGSQGFEAGIRYGVDVGLSALVQEAAVLNSGARQHWARYLRPAKYYTEQLKFRYLLAVEGNDVASGLKWMLASNSVVLMPPPRRETWLAESRLRPWVHYVPLRSDFSDLLDKVAFCEWNLDVCEAVARRSTAHMRQFKDRNATMAQGALRLRAYLDRVRVMAAAE